jgi:hypothetical protein
MKKLYTIVFISLLAVSCIAPDRQAFLAREAAEQERKTQELAASYLRAAQDRYRQQQPEPESEPVSVSNLRRASELASSFKQAAALGGDSQEKEPAARAYKLEVGAYYQQKYSPVFLSCLKSTDHADTSPFSFVAAIGKDGHVLRLYIDHETNIYACVRQTLQQDEFPHPPLSPYYLHVSMNFSK